MSLNQLGSGRLAIGAYLDLNPRTDQIAAKDLAVMPPANLSSAAMPVIGTHQLTVGDLAFLVLGQIVNRRYWPIYMHEEPTTVWLGGPGIEPRVAEIAALRWGRANPRNIEQSLVDDLLAPDDSFRDADAARHIAVYFPRAMEGAILQKLSLPLDFGPGYPASRERTFAPTDAFMESISFLKSKAVDIKCQKLVTELRARRSTQKEVCDAYAVLLIRHLAEQKVFDTNSRRYIDEARRDPTSELQKFNLLWARFQEK